ERIAIVNYSRDPVMAPLSIESGADFQDMFEVRGTTRARRGPMHPPQADGRTIRFRYDGLDGVSRTSTISFSDAPSRLTTSRADFVCTLQPGGRLELSLEACPRADGATPSRERFRAAAAQARWEMRTRRRHGARSHSLGRLFNEWIDN